MQITDLLAFGVKNKASDLHLSAGLPPMIRVHGDVRRINLPEMNAEEVGHMITSVMNDLQRKNYQQNLETDFSFELPNVARFRVNAFNTNRGPAAVFRTIPSRVLTLEELKAPRIFQKISENPRGLVLVTGPTGSGKSTTLAAMINYINETHSSHILTIEDPIEFVHESKKCLINQRELHEHTHSFANALRSALREDPDIILVGEMRDRETISTAITAAETGHLVFGTLHTNSAIQTINRIVDSFDGSEQLQVRNMLSVSLTAVISQSLIPKIGGGRCAVHEILINNMAISNLIRENKVHQIYSQMQLNQQQTGMSTQTQALMKALKEGLITKENALAYSTSQQELQNLIGTV